LAGDVLLSIGGVREAVFVSRPRRFTVLLRGREGGGSLECHLHDPGRLRHLLAPGTIIYYRLAWRPGRRTSCDVVAARRPGEELVLEDTRLANRVFPMVAERIVPGLAPGLEAEKWINGTRVDFIGSDRDGHVVLVEVKSTNLVENRVALFPDAPSKRAHRQLEALAVAARKGARSVIVFTVLRSDADRLRPNRLVDPVFARLLCAYHKVLELYAYRLKPLIKRDTIEVRYAGEISTEPC